MIGYELQALEIALLSITAVQVVLLKIVIGLYDKSRRRRYGR